MKHNIVTSSILPITSTIITAFQVTHNWITCLVFLGLSLLVLYYVLVKCKESRQDRISGIICIAIMVLSSGIGLTRSLLQNKRDKRWQDTLVEERDTKLEKMISKANANDGPSQIELSDYYYSKQEYKKSRTYAQMAADRGNVKGYARLVDLDYWGKGCKPNHESAFQNMIKGQRVDFALFHYSGVMENLSYSEKAILNETEISQQRVRAIMNESGKALQNAGYSVGKAAFSKYHDELVGLYRNGFVPALEALYIESWLNGDRNAMVDYARQLYKVNRIPTDILSRLRFLTLIYPMTEYAFSDYEEHIAMNNYIPALLFRHEMDFDRSKYSNLMLFYEYQLYRAQFQWFKDLNEGKIKEVRFFVSTNENTSEMYHNAKILLETSIKAIKARELAPWKSFTNEQRIDDRTYQLPQGDDFESFIRG